MKYNFDQVTDRSHTDATKWYVVQETLDIPDVTPLWIADMDFAVSDPIQAALKSTFYITKTLSIVPDLGWGLPNGREIFAWAESNCSGFFWRFLS